MRTLLLILAAPLWAQTGLRIIPGDEPIKVTFAYTAPSASACTIEISESPTYSPVVADVDASQFSGSNSDSYTYPSGASRTILSNGNWRLVRVGQNTSTVSATTGLWTSRALASNTHYYLRVCGSATAEFWTPGPSSPISMPRPFLADVGASVKVWGQAAYPEWPTDVTVPLIDPDSGRKMWHVDPTSYSSTFTAAPSATLGLHNTPAAGWTNIANLESPTLYATVTNSTTPIVMYVDAENAPQYAVGNNYGGSSPYDDFLALCVNIGGYPSGTPTTNIQVCLSTDSGQTTLANSCHTGALGGTSGSPGTLTMPSGCPDTYFAGWGVRPQRKAWPRTGYIQASGTSVTLKATAAGTSIPAYGTPANADSFFDADWPAGTKVYITGLGIRTIASVQSATQLTTVENLGTISTNTLYRSLGLAVVLSEVGGTGTINLHYSWQFGRGYPHNLFTGGCSPTSVSSGGDDLVGYPCELPQVLNAPGALFLVGKHTSTGTPEIRLVSLWSNPGACTEASGGSTIACPSNDIPSNALALMGPITANFDASDPTVMYTWANDSAGKPSIYKLQLTSAWAKYNHPFISGTSNPPAGTEFTATNLTPGSQGLDIRAQILANSTYSESACLTLTSLAGVYGSVYVMGNRILFTVNCSGQNNPGWMAMFSTSGTLLTVENTCDGASDPNLSAAGIHNISTYLGGLGIFSSHAMQAASTGIWCGGPFTANVVAIYKGGAAISTDTSLVSVGASHTYNAGTNVGGYDDTWSGDPGSHNYVHLQLQQFCSSTPKTGEAACPRNGAYSMASAIQVGTCFTDAGKNRYGAIGLAADAESLCVVQLTGTPCTGCVDAYARRNANPSYCHDTSDGSSADGFSDSTISTHANSWTAVQQPYGNCANGTAFVLDTSVTPPKTYYINDSSTRGHTFFSSAQAGNATLVGVGQTATNPNQVYAVMKNRSFNLMGNPPDYFVGAIPPWSGFQQNQNAQVQQSYIKCGSTTKVCVDFHHLDPSGGIAPEVPTQTVVAQALNLTGPVSGTSHVYTVSIIGTPDLKRFGVLAHAGDRMLIDKSGLGSVLSDTDVWQYCIAYNAGECRTGSTAVASSGLAYVSLPQVDNPSGYCELSQVSNHIPCIFAGPTTATSFDMQDVSLPDPDGSRITTFGHGMMITPVQYVYSDILQLPNNQLLFTQYLGNGYQTGLVVMDTPTPTSQPATGFTPVPVSYSSSSWYVQFGYEEYGNPLSGQFYCTTRKENCKVAGSTINAATPFSFASETMTAAGSGAKVIIPKIPGMLLFYQIVDNGVAGSLQVVP